MKKAFTLAEVLITLMIIGIVAALTIPSVISNYQQQAFKTGLKKAVSVLNEAIQTSIAVDGETPYENYGNHNNYLFDYLQKHMTIIRSDGYGEMAYSGNKYFYTADGIRFEFRQTFEEQDHDFPLYESSNYAGRLYFGCGSYGLTLNKNNTTKTPCAILVDVNGDRKPNPSYKDKFYANGEFAGKDAIYKYPTPTDKKITDIFNILITEDRAIPYGIVAQRAMYSK